MKRQIRQQNKRTRAAQRGHAAYHRGRIAEYLACLYLMMRGYRIVALRCRTPLGEIDIIARKGRVLSFVEVKARASIDGAAQAISPRQQDRMHRAAAYYIGRHPRYGAWSWRMDALLMAPWRWPVFLPGDLG